MAIHDKSANRDLEDRKPNRQNARLLSEYRRVPLRVSLEEAEDELRQKREDEAALQRQQQEAMDAETEINPHAVRVSSNPKPTPSDIIRAMTDSEIGQINTVDEILSLAQRVKIITSADQSLAYPLPGHGVADHSTKPMSVDGLFDGHIPEVQSHQIAQPPKGEDVLSPLSLFQKVSHENNVGSENQESPNSLDSLVATGSMEDGIRDNFQSSDTVAADVEPQVEVSLMDASSLNFVDPLLAAMRKTGAIFLDVKLPLGMNGLLNSFCEKAMMSMDNPHEGIVFYRQMGYVPLPFA